MPQGLSNGLLDGDAPPGHCLVQILGPDGEAVGNGIVGGERTIVTCAHVINVALGRDSRTAADPRTDADAGPHCQVMVRFPFSGDPGEDVDRPMRVTAWLPGSEETFERRDAAVLTGTEKIPEGARCPTLVDVGYRVTSVTLFGLRSRGESAYVKGQLLGELPNEGGRYQVDQDKIGDVFVRSGASGSPVWDTATGQIVGLVQAIPTSKGAIDVYVLGPELIEEATGGGLYQARQCPYVGLPPYKQEDSDFFFGRDEFVQELLESARTQSLLVVTGKSGGGKSSAVLAGLVPRLMKAYGRDLAVGTCELNDMPLKAVAGALSRAASDGQPSLERVDYWEDKLAGKSLGDCGATLLAATGQRRLLLVLDQFERIGKCQDVVAKDRILQLLADLGHSQLGQVQVVIIIRSDRHHEFMERPGPLQDLFHATRPNWIRNLSEDGLRSAILGPLKKHNIEIVFEEELVREICKDFREAELPPLQVVLTELWSRQVARKITLTAYKRLGGIDEVLGRWADDRFDEVRHDQQAAAKRILTSLAVPGTGDTARPVRRSDLQADWPACEELSHLRIVVIKKAEGTSDEEIVEIAHEALLRGWGRLQEWRRADEDFLRWQSRLQDRRDEWESRERDPSLLLTGPLVMQAEEMRAAHPERTAGLAGFISASKDLQRRHIDRLEAIRRAGIGEHLLNSAPGRLPSALFLGAMALRKEGVFEADFVIRRALALLGRSVHAGIRHAKAVRCVAFNSDGSMLVTASESGESVVWDTTTGREAARLLHDARLTTVAFSPDDEYVVTADAKGVVRVLDYRRRELAGTLEHGAPVVAMAFSPRGGMLATACGDGKARIWRYDTNEPPLVLPDKKSVSAVAFDPSQGAFLVTACGSNVRIWDPGSGQATGSLRLASLIHSIALSGDGAMLAAACSDRSVRIFTIGQRKLVHRLMHQGRVTSVAFSHGGKYLATAVEDMTARVWDVQDAFEVAHLTHDQPISSIDQPISSIDQPISSIGFSPDDTRVATASLDGTARVWDIATGREAVRLVHEDAVHQAVFSSAGDLIATASEDCTARVWHASTGAGKAALRHGEPVNAIAYSSAGDLVATVGRGNPAEAYRGTARASRTVRIWEATTGSETCNALPHPAAVQDLAFGTSVIATACDDGLARIWDLQGGRLISEFPHDGPVQRVAFNPGATLLATASNDSTARIWDLETGWQACVLRHDGWVGSVVFDPVGQLLATAADDKYARIWRVADCLAGGNPQPIARFRHNGAVFQAVFNRAGAKVITVGNDRAARFWLLSDPTELQGEVSDLDHVTAVHVDNMLIATAGDEGIVRVIQVDTAKEIAHFVHEPTVGSMTFNQAGTRLATAGKDGSIRIWSIHERAEMARLIHGGEEPIVALSPDDMSAVTASEDGTALVWPLSRTALLDQARMRITRNLQTAEWNRYFPGLPYEMLRPDLGDPSGT